MELGAGQTGGCSPNPATEPPRACLQQRGARSSKLTAARVV